MKKCVIIYNKKSGKLKPAELINNFYNIVQDHGYELDVITTKKKGDGKEIIHYMLIDIT